MPPGKGAVLLYLQSSLDVWLVQEHALKILDVPTLVCCTLNLCRQFPVPFRS